MGEVFRLSLQRKLVSVLQYQLKSYGNFIDNEHNDLIYNLCSFYINLMIQIRIKLPTLKTTQELIISIKKEQLSIRY